LVALWKARSAPCSKGFSSQGEGAVHQQRHAGLVCDLAHGGDVEHVEARVAQRLAEQQLRFGADGGAPAVDVAGLDEGGGHAEARQRVAQQVVAAAVQRRTGDDVAAGAGQRGDGQRQRGLATGGGDRPAATFERSDALFQHRVGGVADAAVDMARAFEVEQARRMFAALEHEARAEVDGHGACAGGRVGRGAGVQRQGVESGVLCACHAAGSTR
jgi:hypothetical protein